MGLQHRQYLPDEVERAYQEASHAADVLKDKLLGHLRAGQSAAQHCDRYRRRAKLVDLRTVADTVLGEQVFQWQENTAACLIRALARTSEAKLAIHTADWLLEHHPQVGGSEAVLHTALVAAATTLWDADVALRYYHLRSSYAHPPSVEAANMAITACSHSGRVQDALSILQHMPEDGLVPTVYSVIMVVQAANYKKQGHYKEAVQAYRCLPPQTAASSGLVDTLLSVFEAAMRAADSLQDVESIFQELQAVQLADSTRAYNAVLRACAARGRWQLARSYVDRMGQEEVPADTGTFTALIAACLKGGALNEALSTFEWLVSGHDVTDAIPADITTYNTLIQVCHQAGLLEKALEIATWVICAGLPWDETTYRELISTVEIAQLWDNKVVTTPMYQQKPFGTCASPVPPELAAHDDDPFFDSSNMSRGLAHASNANDFGGIILQGHPGYASLAASMKARTGSDSHAPSDPSPLTHRHSNNRTVSTAGAKPKRVPPPLVPLAIFPEQLRPAPVDSMRLMYLDHHKELMQESWLAAIKLGAPSWARTLTKGSAGSLTSTACSAQLAATVSPDDVAADGDGFKSSKVSVPKLPKLMPPPDPVDISPAPTFRHLTLDQVTSQRLQHGRVSIHVAGSAQGDDADAPFSPGKSPSAVRARHRRTTTNAGGLLAPTRPGSPRNLLTGPTRPGSPSPHHLHSPANQSSSSGVPVA